MNTNARMANETVEDSPRARDLGRLERVLRAILVSPERRRAYPLQLLYAVLLQSESPGVPAEISASLEEVSAATALAAAITLSAHQPSWLRAFLLAAIAMPGPFRWMAFRILASEPEPPIRELLAQRSDAIGDGELEAMFERFEAQWASTR